MNETEQNLSRMLEQVTRERDEALANAARWREEIDALKEECVEHIKFINYLREKHGDY